MSYIICWFLFNSKMLADSKMPCSNTQKFSAIPSRSLCSQEMSIPEVVFVSKVPPLLYFQAKQLSDRSATQRVIRAAERRQRRAINVPLSDHSAAQ